MRPMNVLRSTAALWAMSAALATATEQPELTLTDAASQALESNLDLASQRRALAASREAIGIARAPLLPQLGGGIQAQILDSERSDDNRGFVPDRSVTAGAEISQLIYDESDWADFQVQKKTYVQQSEQLESFRLGVIQDAANAYFELDRSIALVRIQEANRELTRQSLETTRARVATGYSSKRELLRWQAQIAGNDTSVTQAAVQVLTSQFELNRVRNRPREDVVIPAPSSIDEHGFVYTSEVIAKAVALPDADRRLRDSLVRFGLDRSPTLRAIDAAIEAEERVLTASKREFWVPTVSVSANVDHVLDSNASSTPFSETEWGARALLTYPVFVGGAKIASLRSAREAVSSLRLARRAETITLDDGIRTAFAQASGAYQTIGFAREQERAAKKNHEYVYDAYVLGVADYLQLLDAQNQNLVAQLASANALYDFLDALIAAEQQIAFFPFLEARAEVDTFIDGLENTLQARP